MTLAASEGCEDDTASIVLPFYEGIAVSHPARAATAVGARRVDVAYPGAMSAPLVLWSCRADEWNAVAVSDPVTPTTIGFHAEADGTEISLTCLQGCTFVATKGRTWQSAASDVARAWRIPGSGVRLADRYRGIDFYVNRWIDAPQRSIRVAHDLGDLDARMRSTPSTSLVFVYGLDPGEVDLKGRYFQDAEAEAGARRIVSANPSVAQFHWLNLRSYKHAIDALGIDEPLTDDVRAMAKLYAGGVRDRQQYNFRQWEMCLGSREWQASRLRELRHLIGLGYKVIALDEFPTSPEWGAFGCQSREHLHRPGDFADEWRVALAFVKTLEEEARAHGVLFGSEEPSAALVPYVSGYADRTFNRDGETGMYSFWMKSPDVTHVELFSTMFGKQVTPYTDPFTESDPEPRGGVPAGWVIQRKR